MLNIFEAVDEKWDDARNSSKEAQDTGCNVGQLTILEGDIGCHGVATSWAYNLHWIVTKYYLQMELGVQRNKIIRNVYKEIKITY